MGEALLGVVLFGATVVAIAAELPSSNVEAGEDAADWFEYCESRQPLNHIVQSLQRYIPTVLSGHLAKI